MNLDIIETQIEQIYSKSYSDNIIAHRVMGFKVEEDIISYCKYKLNGVYYNFGHLFMCDSNKENIKVQLLPGTNLYRYKSADKIVNVTNLWEEYSEYKFRYLNPNGVSIGTLYNGKYLFITDVYYHTLTPSYSYIHILLYLYQIVTGTRMSLYSNLVEAKSFMDSLDESKFTPTTCTYIEMLYKITDSYSANREVLINPKYNGTPCWLYLSKTTPMSLISQYRSKGRNKYVYIGRVTQGTSCVDKDPSAILCERVLSGGEFKYLTIDYFDKENSSYYNRRLKLGNLLSNSNSIGQINIKLEFGLTMMYLSGDTKESLYQHVIKSNITPLSRSLLSNVKESVDGVVLYCADNQPIKVKLSSEVTVDVKCLYKVEDGKEVYKWITEDPYVLSVAKDPIDMDFKVGNTYVLELRLCNGEVLRVRKDRIDANPDRLINNIVTKFRTDSVYSVMSMWKCRDIKLILLINRAYKRYCHFVHIPDESRVIDMGSGNGGDLHIWLDKKYDVLCIEKDRERASILSKSCSNNNKIIVAVSDMQNVIRVLRGKTRKYSYCSFMRSISNLTEEEIVKLLIRLKKYNIKKIVIITMVSDYIKDIEVVDDIGQSFKIACNNTSPPMKVTVTCLVSGTIKQYSDYCYSIDKWKNMSSLSGYKVDIQTQASFTRSVFRLSKVDMFYPCTTDVCMVLTPIKSS